MQQNQNQNLPPQPLNNQIQQKPSHHFNWAVFLVVAIALCAALVIVIQKYKTDEEIDSMAPAVRSLMPKNEKPKEKENNISTPTPAETADWKVYKNKKYRFEFKYPENFRVTGNLIDESDEELPIGLWVKPPTDLYGNVYGQNLKIDPAGVTLESDSFESIPSELCKYSEFFVEKKAIKCFDTNNFAIRVDEPLANWSKNNVIIYFIDEQNPYREELKDNFNKILSTFKFTN